MIDRAFIGREFPPLEVDVERGQLKFFAKAMGQADPIYTDEAAAKAAGFRDLPAPPTFMVALELKQPDPFQIYRDMGIDMNRVLHGEQKFRYGASICAGDRIVLKTRVVDIYDKKGGAMEFVTLGTSAFNQNGEDVGGTTRVLIVRNG